MPGRVSGPSAPPDVLGDGLGGGAGEVEEELSALAEERSQEARHGEDEVAMRNGREHLLLQPLRPQELTLLLARRAKGTFRGRRTAHKHARPARRRTTGGRSHAGARPHLRNPLSTRSTTGRSGPCCRAKRAGQTRSSSSRWLLDELVKRRLARLPRPVDPAGDLHAQPRAGGRVAGRIGKRTARLSRGQGSPRTVPAGVRIVREPHGAGGPDLEALRRSRARTRACTRARGCVGSRPAACRRPLRSGRDRPPGARRATRSEPPVVCATISRRARCRRQSPRGDPGEGSGRTRGCTRGRLLPGPRPARRRPGRCPRPGQRGRRPRRTRSVGQRPRDRRRRGDSAGRPPDQPRLPHDTRRAGARRDRLPRGPGPDPVPGGGAGPALRRLPRSPVPGPDDRRHRRLGRPGGGVRARVGLEPMAEGPHRRRRHPAAGGGSRSLAPGRDRVRAGDRSRGHPRRGARSPSGHEARRPRVRPGPPDDRMDAAVAERAGRARGRPAARPEPRGDAPPARHAAARQRRRLQRHLGRRGRPAVHAAVGARPDRTRREPAHLQLRRDVPRSRHRRRGHGRQRAVRPRGGAARRPPAVGRAALVASPVRASDDPARVRRPAARPLGLERGPAPAGKPGSLPHAHAVAGAPRRGRRRRGRPADPGRLHRCPAPGDEAKAPRPGRAARVERAAHHRAGGRAQPDRTRAARRRVPAAGAARPGGGDAATGGRARRRGARCGREARAADEDDLVRRAPDRAASCTPPSSTSSASSRRCATSPRSSPVPGASHRRRRARLARRRAAGRRAGVLPGGPGGPAERREAQRRRGGPGGARGRRCEALDPGERHRARIRDIIRAGGPAGLREHDRAAAAGRGPARRGLGSRGRARP